jgi:hypothetical protein
MRTARWLEPDSNHTSKMSVSFRNSFPPHFGQDVPAGRILSAGVVNHESAPPFLKSSFTAANVASERCASLHFTQ